MAVSSVKFTRIRSRSEGSTVRPPTNNRLTSSVWPEKAVLQFLFGEVEADLVVVAI